MFDGFFVFDDARDRFRAQKVAAKALDVSAISNNFGTPSRGRPSDSSMKRYIDAGIASSDCLVVLIGENTAADRWVTYAVGRAVLDFDKPIIGVKIHTLFDEDRRQGVEGEDPFTRSGLSPRSLDQIETYDPPFTTNAFALSHIQFGLRDWMDAAIRESIRRRTSLEARGIYSTLTAT